MRLQNLKNLYIILPKCLYFLYCYFASLSKWILLKTIEIIKEDFEMFGKDKNKNAKEVVASLKEKIQIHILDLDDGEFAFMEWLNSENKNSTANHIILKRYEKDKECILNDNTLHSYIKVKNNDGAPFCTYCQDDRCAHVGFTICVMQLFERKEILLGEDESMLDLLKD
jgi:hypothetical protein